MSKHLIREIVTAVWKLPDLITTGNKRTRATVRDEIRRIGLDMTQGFDRLNASYEGLAGDIASLKAAAATLQSALDTALADQDAKTAAAVSDALAAFNAQLDVVAGRFEGLDASTPAVEPEPTPDPEVPADGDVDPDAPVA